MKPDKKIIFEIGQAVAEIRGVRGCLFWTPAPVLTNQIPDPAPGQ